VKLTYGSFATDAGFRGAVVLVGDLDPVMFAVETGVRGINPGGELMAIPFDTEDEAIPSHVREAFLDERNHNRLLTKLEAVSLFEGVRLGTLEGDGKDLN